ncbi:MAG: TonB-dependent receptor plug domain-containing protein [Planctomycetota bacterium]|jgi:iron complex outermembrane receptor protein
MTSMPLDESRASAGVRAAKKRRRICLLPNAGHHARGVALLLAILATAYQCSAIRAQDTNADQRNDDASLGEPTLHDDLEDLDLLELEIPVVVTAARREQKINTVPYAVSIITAEDIRRSGARSIPDALRLVPGVDVADLSAANAAVSPRGFHGFVARQVLVLVDGRQIFDSLFGGTLWGSWPFLLEDIERIEVIRGPGGVAWGANAVNGVINIITKDPTDQVGLTLTSSGGSRGSFKQYIGYGIQQDERLRLRISGEYEAHDGFRKGGSILRSLDDEYKTGRIALHALFDIGPEDSLTLSAGSALVDGGYPPTPLAGLGLRRNSRSRASFVMGTWSHETGHDERFEVTAYVNEFEASPGLPAIDYRYQQIALQFGHTFRPAEAHRLTWGVDTRVDLLDATNADPFMLSKDFVSTAIIGVYLQDEWQFAPKWTLDLGARIDYEFYGGFQPSARAAFAYTLTRDSMIYGAVSRAFQMPPAGLRFLDIPLLNGIAHAKGNRDVEVESVVAYELGYRGRFFDRLDTNLNLFWHELDDVTTLSPMLGPPGLIRMDLDNRAGASIYGAEVDAKLVATKKLTLLANYTYQRLDWRSSSPLHEKDAITPPEHKFMLGARYSPTDDLHLSGHLYYVDDVEAPLPSNPFSLRDIDSYFRLDLNAEYDFADDRASIAVGVRNLLDSSHYEGGTLFLNDAEVPRMIYAELRIAIR